MFAAMVDWRNGVEGESDVAEMFEHFSVEGDAFQKLLELIRTYPWPFIPRSVSGRHDHELAHVDLGVVVVDARHLFPDLSAGLHEGRNIDLRAHFRIRVRGVQGTCVVAIVHRGMGGNDEFVDAIAYFRDQVEKWKGECVGVVDWTNG